MSAISVQDIVYSVLFSVVLVFNIAGNSLVIYIITNERGMKTSTNYLLLNLAVADLLYGVFLTPQMVFIPILDNPPLPKGVLGDSLCKLIIFGSIAWIASRASIFTMVCLSVERYFAVCRPHSFSQRFSSKIVKVLVMVSWIYGVIMISPLIVEVHLDKHLYCSIRNDTVLGVYSVYALTELILVFSLMLFVSVKICISLWCRQTVEPTGEREITERKKKKKVTLCVLAVVVTFVLSWTPVALRHARRVFSIESIKLDLATSKAMTFVNAALDPFLFSYQSSKFKVLARKLVQCCRKKPSEQ